jgi:manganese/zinc/iron transport system permease protein
MYLIAFADVAPGLVDRGADDIEHVLGPEIVDQLEDLLEEQKMMVRIPGSPHDLGTSVDSSSDSSDGPAMPKGAGA